MITSPRRSLIALVHTAGSGRAAFHRLARRQAGRPKCRDQSKKQCRHRRQHCRKSQYAPVGMQVHKQRIALRAQQSDKGLCRGPRQASGPMPPRAGSSGKLSQRSCQIKRPCVAPSDRRTANSARGRCHARASGWQGSRRRSGAQSPPDPAASKAGFSYISRSQETPPGAASATSLKWR